MKTLKSVAIFLMIVFLAACGPSAEERGAMEKSKQDSVMAVASSSAAQQPDGYQTIGKK
jgi:ABC-type Zn uptake system ZnuABC Zn-binding protein ZnuA